MTRTGRLVRRLVVGSIAIGLASWGMTPLPASGTAGPPTLGLRVAKAHVSLTRAPHQPIPLDVGALVTAIGGSFTLYVTRPDLADPTSVTQVWTDGTGTHERPLPPAILDGWNGLARFFHIEVTDDTGHVVHRTTLTFCPNTYDPQRLEPYAPSDPTFPYSCSSFNPFPREQIWGIDRAWGVNPLESSFFFGPYGGGAIFRGPDGRYTVTVSIAHRYVQLFGLDPGRVTRSVDLTVRTSKRGCRRPPCPRPVGGSGGSASGGGGESAPVEHPRGGRLPRLPEIPTSDPPDPQFLPDLASLPAFNVVTYSRRGKDYLSFAATEWVGGGSALDIEGFRRPRSNVMDAYQYFYTDGQVVGRAPVGTMEFDTRHGHNHWHFEQFARYSLLDSSQSLAVRSHKQSFCIAPTDGIDLLLPGVVVRPTFFGFFGNCGAPTSVWVREMMPIGWGDTYYQSVAGQAFQITDLPNGTYYIEVQVNPTGLVYEQDTSNDVALRQVVIRGRPGHRTVCVPAINGVDPEGRC